MTLEQELEVVRKDIATDGYEMSIGEVASLYRDKELRINPEYQRYFRWDDGRKTRFVESILLGIPIPPIFVFQADDGSWELVDGLQRLSTLLELMGILVDADGNLQEPSTLGATRLLPSLAGYSWEGAQALSSAHKLDIKRSRLRVEILKRESDPTSKYELFQRLNTGGAALSDQEVRNCTMVMVNAKFFHWLRGLGSDSSFMKCISITENQKEKQFDLELVLRFLALCNRPYDHRMDVHEYLDGSAIHMAQGKSFSMEAEGDNFRTTFQYLHESLGASGSGVFRRWDDGEMKGKFLISVFEVLAVGVGKNLEALTNLEEAERTSLIATKARSLGADATFTKYSGAGVRGTSRLANLIPMAEQYLKP